MNSAEPANPDLARLVTLSNTTISGSEDATGAVEVLAVFDHDYQAHILVQEWDHTVPEPCWTYRLWFRTCDFVVAVHQFHDAVWPEPPFVEAAAIVADWRRFAADTGDENLSSC